MFTRISKSLNQLLDNLATRSIFKSQSVTSRHLLSLNELNDLYLRSQQINAIKIHKKEIAHKRIGDKRSIFKGYGIDYEESRHYIPGDDPRYMNWNLTARTGQLYMKVFRQERQPGVFIVIDKRLNMRFGSRKRLKVTQAIRVAALAAFNAEINNKLVGGVIIDDQLTWLRETHNKQEIFDFLNQARRPLPDFSSYEKKQEQTLNNVLPVLNNIITKGSIVYLVSDFHDLDGKSKASLVQLSQEHEVLPIQILDTGESQLPKNSKIKISYPGKSEYTEFNDSVISNRHFKEQVNNFYAEKVQLLLTSGLNPVCITTIEDEPGQRMDMPS